MFLFFGIWWFAVWFLLFHLFILYSCVSLALSDFGLLVSNGLNFDVNDSVKLAGVVNGS